MPPNRRTWTHAIFLDTPLRTRLHNAGEWDRASRFQAGYLRLCWSRFPGDPDIPAAIAELLRTSDDFRRLWDEHLIHNWPQKQVRIHHELAGPLELELELEVMRPDDDLDLAFACYTTTPDSPTERPGRRRLAAAPLRSREHAEPVTDS